MANYVLSKPQRVIALCAAMEIQAAARVTLHTILKVYTELRNDFIGEKVMVHKIGYPKEPDMPRLDMRGSTVVGFI